MRQPAIPLYMNVTLAGLALLAAGCFADPPQFDPAVLEAGVGDGRPDAGVEALPPPTEPGDVVWQVETGFSVEAIALDPQGNLVVVGKGRASGMGSELALGKYAANGAYLWHKMVGGPGNQGATALAVTADGTIVVTGGFEGQASFGEMSKQSVGGSDAFVAAYAPDGKLRSLYTFGGAGDEEGLAVAIDPASGDWIVTGHGSGPFMVETNQVGGPFVLKLAPSGAVRWAHTAGRNLVTTAPNGGAVYAAGSAAKDQVTRHAPLTGAIEWAAQIGQDIHPSAGFADGRGLLLLTGGFYTSLTTGVPPIRSFGKRDAFLMALNQADGKIAWAKVVLASQGEDSGRAMCVGPAGQIYVAGRYFGTPGLAFGDPETTQHAFLSRHETDGDTVWTRLYREGTSAASVLCGAAGGIVAGGEGWLMMVLP